MANHKYFPSDNDLFKAQYDILFESLKNNPLLPSNAVPVLNKALLTKNKQLIKAVNEILENVTVIDGKMKSLMNTYNDFIGNPNIDLDETADLKKIDKDLLRAVIKIAKDINGQNLDSPIDISEIGNSVKESIKNINQGLIDVKSDINKKQEGITYFESCLFKGNWKKINPSDEYYSYMYHSILIPDNTIINITPNIKSKEDEYAICYAGILPTISNVKNESGENCYLFRAKNPPNKDISIFIYLLKDVKEEK